MSQRVVLGPMSECHPGINRSLLESPPDGIEYTTGDLDFVFEFPRHEGLAATLDPFDAYSVCESIEYDFGGSPPSVVHAFLTPVRSEVPWVIHTSALFPVLSYGKSFAIGSPERVRARDVPDVQRRLRERVLALHFVDSRCKAVLFYTQAYKQRTLRYLSARGVLTSSELDRFAEKSQVLPPTVKPFDGPRNKFDETTVVYAGRDFGTKRGDLALSVFRALAAEYSEQAQFIYVGDVPAALAAERSNLRFYPFLEHDTYLQLLERSHIFFAPTNSEDYGMALLEAANRGLAIVSSGLPGLPHIHELFEEGVNGHFVRTDQSDGERLNRFGRHLRGLLDHRERLDAMSSANRRLFSRGKLSLPEHQRELCKHYTSAFEDLARGPRPGDTRDAITQALACQAVSERRYSEAEYQTLLENVAKTRSTYLVFNPSAPDRPESDG